MVGIPVYLNVESRLDERALAATARRLVDEFARVGNDISHGLGSSLSKAFGAIDGSAARREFLMLEQAARRAADAQEAAAAREVRALGLVEVGQRRLNEVTAKYGAESSRAAAANVALADSNARAAKAQRDHVAAMTDGAAAHTALANAAEGSTAAIGRFHTAATIASAGVVGGFGVALDKTTKSAADFQQQQMKMHAAAGVSTQDMKTWSDGILRMTGQVGYSSKELMNGAFTLAKYGYDAADGLKVLEAAAQGANAEQADLSTTVNALALSMHNFNATPAEASRVMSQMITAVGEGKGTLNEFAGALDAVEPMAHNLGLSLQDVWGTLAQISQSGTSYDQGAQWMLNAMRSLSNAQGPARDAMQQLGLNADDISEHLGQRGLTGTIQYLSDTVMQHFADANHVNVGEMRNAAQAQENLGEMFQKMSPYARQHAEALANNAEGSRAYTMAMRSANEQDKTQMEQARQLIDRIDGFSKRFANGRQVLETYTQAMNDLLGTQEGAQVALQITGDHADQTNDKIQAIATTYTNADGSVKGFNESQDTLNAKLRDAHAAFGAAEAEIGSAFVPIMTDAAKGAKWLGDEMAKHPAIAQDATTALGLMGGAWLAIKGYNIVSTVLSPIASGIGTLITKFGGVNDAAATASGTMRGMGAAAQEGVAGVEAAAAEEVAAEGRVAQSAEGANAAMAGGKAGGAGMAAAAGPLGIAAAGSMGVDSILNSLNNRFHTNAFTKFGEIPGSGAWVAHQLGMAGGGPVHGRGPNGIDSVHALLAPGEHVLTHHDVHAMGGHAGVYAFRRSLHGGLAIHRQYGGEIPGFADGGTPDNVAAQIIAQGQARGMPPNVIRSALAAGIVESGLRNLNYGDRDSLGIFQQRPSQGWGSASQILDPNYAIAKYYQAASHVPGAANMDPGALAQSVERSGFPGRYDQHMGQANDYYNRLSGDPTKYTQTPVGIQGDPLYVSMSQNGSGGATPGRGANGQPGYYTANPERVASAQENLRHINEEIKEAEERKASLKASASQAERDSLDERIRHLTVERDEAQERLAKAEQGTFHGARGQGGSPFLPVPLASNFGLGKGLPGLAEWAVGFLEDLVLGPMETAAMARMGMGTGALGGTGGASGLGAAGFGFPNPGQIPGVPGADVGAPEVGAPPRDNVIGPGGGDGGPSGGSAGGSRSWSNPFGTATGASAASSSSPWSSPFGAARGTAAPPAPAPRFDQPGPLDFLLNGTPQGMSPGFKPGTGIPGQDDLLPGISPWDIISGSGRLAARGGNAISDWAHGNPFGMSGIGGPRPGFHRMQVPPYTAPPPPPQPGLAPETANLFVPGAHFAGGGQVPGYGAGPSSGDPDATDYLPGDESRFAWQLSQPDWNAYKMWQFSGQRPDQDPAMRLPGPSGDPGSEKWGWQWSGGGPRQSDESSPHQKATTPTYHLSSGGFPGGPSGTDTIPAWLSPGEFVENTSAVQKYGAGFMNALDQGQIDPSSVRYYAPGGSTDDPSPPQQPAPGAPQGAMKTPGGPNGPQVQKPPDAPQPGQPAGPKPSGGGAVGPGQQKGTSDLTTPGAGEQQPGTGQPAQPGIGFSGGLIGAAESAASSAAGAAAGAGSFGAAGGAASSAMNLGFEELNRAASAGAQYAGIGVEGVLESLIPNAGGSSSDWSQTIPGRLLMGVTGVRPAGQQNTAGQTQQPFASNASQDKYATPDSGGNTQQLAPIQIMGPVTVNGNNADEIHQSLNQSTNMAGHTLGATWGTPVPYP